MQNMKSKKSFKQFDQRLLPIVICDLGEIILYCYTVACRSNVWRKWHTLRFEQPINSRQMGCLLLPGSGNTVIRTIVLACIFSRKFTTKRCTTSASLRCKFPREYTSERIWWRYGQEYGVSLFDSWCGNWECFMHKKHPCSCSCHVCHTVII